MPLMRTGSAKSTLSMMQRRATKYQKYLTLTSVFLIITSTIVIFTAIILLKFYFMSSLAYWSMHFQVTPILMICLGVYMFLVSIYGFAISGTENRPLLIVFAVLLSVAFIFQLGSIFSAIEVRNKISMGTRISSFQSTFVNYSTDASAKAEWDNMQTELRCCGAESWNRGYQDYSKINYGDGKSVPDSCCHVPREDCGHGALRQTDLTQLPIFSDGCITVLVRRLQQDILPMMAVYAGVGVLIALAELIAVVLTSAYVAQISRRRQREEKVWNAVRGEEMETMNRPHGGGDRDNHSTEHETMC